MVEINENRVALVNSGQTEYPSQPPFHPDTYFPEYPFGDSHLQSGNNVYGAVRESLRLLGLDQERFGTAAWNPLGELIRPGDFVVIKPNFVISDHPLGEVGVAAAVAHASVIRPLLDFAFKALDGRGKVTIADCPIKEVDFQRTLRISGLTPVIEFFESVAPGIVDVVDLRDLQAIKAGGIITSTKRLVGDPLGYGVIDLKDESMLAEISSHHTRMRSTAAVYENVISENHNERVNRYSIANSVLKADAFLSVAKLKTHCKTGVTLSLKNLIGITNEKRWLPHHRAGLTSQGGDCLPDHVSPDLRASAVLLDNLARRRHGGLAKKYVLPAMRLTYRSLFRWWFRRLFKPTSLEWGLGDWYGNDTLWRTVIDLNMILHYATQNGRMSTTRQRRYLSVIDGVVAGEGDGPLRPAIKPCGAILAGISPVAVDIACAQFMGFDYEKIPQLREANRLTRYSLGGVRGLADLEITSNDTGWRQMLSTGQHLGFVPPRGWRGHIEL